MNNNVFRIFFGSCRAEWAATRDKNNSLVTVNNARLMTLAGCLTVISVAVMGSSCSGSASNFSEEKVSGEAQAVFNVYEDFKSEKSFLSQLEQTLQRESSDFPASMKGLDISINGKNFNHFTDLLNANTKMNKAKLRLGSAFASIKSLPIKASDFQLSLDMTYDMLNAGKDQAQRQNVLSKYGKEKTLRAARANMVMATIFKIHSADQKDGLSLSNDGSGSTQFQSSLKDLGAALIQAYSPVGRAKGERHDANAALNAANTNITVGNTKIEELKKKAIETCMASFSSANIASCQSFTTGGPEEKRPNNGMARNYVHWNTPEADAITSLTLESKVTTPGRGNCGAHQWKARCANAGSRKGPGALNPREWLYSDSSTEHCEWEYDSESSPTKQDTNTDGLKAHRESVCNNQVAEFIASMSEDLPKPEKPIASSDNSDG